MVDAAFGEVMVTCEKISWLIREGERWLKPEKRSPGVMVFSCPCTHRYRQGANQCVPGFTLVQMHPDCYSTPPAFTCLALF